MTSFISTLNVTKFAEVHESQIAMCPLKSSQDIANINLDALIRVERGWTNQIGTTEIQTSLHTVKLHIFAIIVIIL